LNLMKCDFLVSKFAFKWVKLYHHTEALENAAGGCEGEAQAELICDAGAGASASASAPLQKPPLPRGAVADVGGDGGGARGSRRRAPAFRLHRQQLHAEA
jgi:hypothetical protein